MKLTTKTAEIKRQKRTNEEEKRHVAYNQMIEEEIKKRVADGRVMKPPTKKTKQQMIEELIEEDAAMCARIDAALAEALTLRSNPNSDGWRRLCEILDEAKTDKRILSSPGALEFLNVVFDIAADSFTCDGAMQAFRPLAPILAGDQLKDNTGRLKGGETMKKRKAAHIEILKQHVIDILKNPATSDWTDPAIARFLMKPERALNVYQGREMSEKSLTGYVREIRGMYKSGKLTS